jgi:hypothetical protein
LTGKSTKSADGRGWKSTSEKLNKLRKQLSLFQNIKNPQPTDETYTQRRLFDIVTDSGKYHSKISKQQLDAHLRNSSQGPPPDDLPLLKDAIKVHASKKSQDKVKSES